MKETQTDNLDLVKESQHLRIIFICIGSFINMSSKMRMPNKRTRTHIIHFDFDLVCFAFRLRFCSHTSTFADPFSFRRNRHAHMQMDKRTKNNNECANRMRAAATARKMSAENRFANKFKFGIPDCLNVCLKQ